MEKVFVDFDATAYRNRLIKLKNEAKIAYQKHKGTAEESCWRVMNEAFNIALREMENYASHTYTKRE